MSDYINNKLNYVQEKIDNIADTANQIDKNLALHEKAFIAHTEQDELMHAELQKMNEILELNTKSLIDHVKRTNNLEELVLKIDARLGPLEVKSIQEDAIKQWKKDAILISAKVAGGLVALSGVAAFLIKHFR